MDAYLALVAGICLSAAIAAMALAFHRHAQALEASRRDSLTDTLTGLGNRRKLLEDLEEMLGGRRFSRLLVVLDLDGFKAYNDVFGHPAGDVLLARLGRRIEAALGGGGRAYRLGGDEFCALIDGRGGEYEAVVAAVSAPAEGLSASHGVVALPCEAESPQAALQLADRRLYVDKADRRRGAPRRAVREALSEANDRCAGGRDESDAVTALAGRVARELGLWGEQVELVVRAVELRDVAKAAIPEAILAQGRGLDDVDQQPLRQHREMGGPMLSAAPALSPVAELARACDERWDGSGYPDGLSGESIPIGARVVAVCEAFRELTEDRRERDRAALLRLRQQAGRRFDPEVVEALAAAIPVRTGERLRARRAGVLATLALAAVALLPGTAFAGTVSFDKGKLSVKASAGQDNKITIWSGQGQATNGTIVEDAGVGVTLSPGAGCTPNAPHRVSCPLSTSLHVEAGDGNDAVVAYTWAPVTLRGGAGNDSLWGGGGKDDLDGQEGNDTLGGGFGGDSLRGSGGIDTVDYSYYTNPVAVTVDGAANDGAAGENANVATDVEDIVGGQAADVLIGDGDANLIDGGGGADALHGAGGDDRLRLVDGQRDHAYCGSGRDSVTADQLDLVGADCEEVARTAQLGPGPGGGLLGSHATPLRLRGGRVRMSRHGVARVRLRCLSETVNGCRGTLEIVASGADKATASRRARRRVIGRARFHAARGRSATVRVRISRNGRRRVLRRRRLRCRASVAIRLSDGSRATISTPLTLLAPKGGGR